jgi:hypothetical protein
MIRLWPVWLCVLAPALVYADNWRDSVGRLLPSASAVDVADYEPSGGAPVLKIDFGTLGEAFGVAVFAADDTVTIDEPATGPADPSVVAGAR